jgi:hypothetical protein
MTNASHVRSSADPEEVSAQIDLIGVPRPLIGFELSAAPNGGSGVCWTFDASDAV